MRCFMKTRILFACLALLSIGGMISTAQAAIVTVSADGVGPLHFQPNEGDPGLPGDYVLLMSSSDFTVDVPTGSPVQVQLGNFNVGYSARDPNPSNFDYTFSLIRDITINSVVHSITQDALLEIRHDADTLTVYESLPTPYVLSGLGTVTLTALQVGPLTIDTLGDHNFTVYGTFELVIPEPATLIIWSLLSLTFGGLGLRFWQRGARPGVYPSVRTPWSNEARTAILQIIERGRTQ
jgi:hypothetical protein